MSGRGREALPDVRERSGGTPGCPGVVGSGREDLRNVRECPGVVRRPSLMFGSGLEALSDVWSGREALPDVLEWSGVVRSGREDLPNVREWSGGPPECPGVVRRPSRRSGSVREAIPDVWD